MTIDESFRELGLDPRSSDAEVKDAWRRLAARWHPDRNPSPEALRRIQRINRAIEEIRQWRASGFDAPAADSAGADDTPEEVIEQQVSVSLEEACTGCSRTVQGEIVESCAECDGTGEEPAPSPCPACDGSGRVRPATWFPWLAAARECEACEGHGEVHATCAACDGRGHAPPRRYRCSVDVPAGSRPGDVLHVRVPARARERALHLRVRVTIEPHEVWRLDADGSIHGTLPVDGFAWMAERWTEVPSPRGAQQMRLRRNATTYRLKGQGLAGADFFVTVEPLFPSELSAEQQLLIDRLVASNTGARGTAAGQKMAEWRKRSRGRRAGEKSRR